MNWRGAFFFFGVIGLLWCVSVAIWFRNRPEEHSEVNDAELALINSGGKSAASDHSHVPWRGLLTNPSMLALCLMYSLVNYGWAFNITYLPSYLEQRYDVAGSDLLAAMYKGAPLWVGAAGCLSGSVFVNFFSKRLGSRSWGRRAVGVIAMLGCMVCWLGARQAPNVHMFCLYVSLAAFCIDSTLGAAWATCQDLGRAHTAVTAAYMNTIGTLGAALAGWGTGTLVQYSVTRHAAAQHLPTAELSQALTRAAVLDGYQLVFLTYAAVYAIAAAAWLAVDSNRPIVDD
jgi:predicted MFS family arabinose efflux permease